MINLKSDSKQLTQNFNSDELDCHCNECKETIINLKHILKLQELRDKIKKPIKINSGFRCVNHNKAIGGTVNSQHTLGNATDISVRTMSIDELVLRAEELEFDGIGIYDTFVHLDSRGSKARWDLRANPIIKV